MRLIHTADWHLCDRLGRVDRTTDLRDRVEQIARLCESRAVDVLLVAGDLFSEHASLEDMKESLDHLSKTFATFFDRGGTILAVTGNHDREARVELIRQGMRLATPDAGRRFRPGRTYLLNQPFAGTLQAAGAEQVQFVLMPYPTTVRYGLPTDRFSTSDEQNRDLNARAGKWLNEAIGRLDPKLPTVVVGHLHVTGGELSHSLYRIAEQDDVVFDPASLGANRVQYVALEHIHKPQALAGLSHVRYAGSLDRLDFGERDDEKGVVLIDLGPTGLLRNPEQIPVAATPMHKLMIADPANEITGLSDRVADRESALVHVTVTHVPGGPTRDEIVRAVRAAFPRHTEIVWAKSDGPGASGQPGGIAPAADHRTTIREFLARELKDDQDREALVQLAETFLTAEATS